MNDGWEVKKLSEVCVIKPPKTEARRRLADNDLVSFLPMEDLGVSEISVTATKERKLKDVAGSYTYFADNDVLLAKITPCFENGKLGIAHNLKNGIGFGSSEYIVFRLDGRLTSEYLYYFLSQTTFREEGKKRMTGAVGHKRVAKEFIENSEIGFPPIAEQKRIVAILGETFEAIDKAKQNAEKNLQRAGELFDSHLQNIFANPGDDWEEKSFEDVCQISSTLIDPRLPKYQQLLHVGGANIETKTGGLFDLKTAEEERLISGKFWFDASMVLYSKIRPYLMKVARPDFEGLCSADIYPLSSKHGCIDRNFLFHLLLSPGFTEYAKSGSARAGMPKVNREHLFAYRCWLPPAKVQQAVAKHLDKLSAESYKLEEIYSRKLESLDELKRSILQKAFNGDLP
jgi:type I restriction enzyme S subunit